MALVPGAPIAIAAPGVYPVPYPQSGGQWTQLKLENATAFGLTLYMDGAPVHSMPAWVVDLFPLTLGPSGPVRPAASPITSPAPQLQVATVSQPASGAVPGTLRPSFAQPGDTFPGYYPLALSTQVASLIGGPQIGQLVSDNFGPAAQTDCMAINSVTLLSFILPMTAGQDYLITARYQGLVIGAAPNWVNVQLDDSANLIQPGQAFIMSENGPNLVVAQEVCGGISTEIKAPASGNNTITMIINTNGGSTAGVRTLARSCEIVVVRIN